MPKGFGLQGMAERVAALSGQLDIETAPGKGCRLKVELPLQEEATAEKLLNNSADDVSTLTKIQPTESLILCCEQSSRLEKILSDYIGSLASTVLQQMMQQVVNSKELVARLSPYIPVAYRTEFEERLTFLFDPLPSQAITTAQATGGLVLCGEQSSWLDKILADYSGSLASTLLQQLKQQVHNCKELVAKLVSQIRAAQPPESEESLTLLLDAAFSQLKTTGKDLSNSSYQTIDESFLRQCEQQLTDLVGPFAPFLIKETLHSSPGISRLELVQTIAAKIPDAMVGIEFQQQMYFRSGIK